MFTMNRLKCILPTSNTTRHLLEGVTGHGEKPGRVVQFNASTSIPAVREFTLNEHMEASSRRRNLRIGIEPLNNVLRYVVDVSSLRISAVIEIHTNDGIIVSEHESDAIRISRMGVLERGFDRHPCFGIRRRRELTTPRCHRDLGRLPVSRFFSPADPLVTLT
ncbi:hypothetical protein C489_13493 [Natrinema versiforme JCM 10478]|uniref:Uncharacterized protein n=1 Tax=Natrinema versiforme JCM 10478 TaxID=1227496 RepID=L9XZY3_9EURY|nr:hypothetical protein C489_13493 [Natrinema versiforme JCM 10478]